MLTKNLEYIEAESKTLVGLIEKELINKYRKSREEAKKLIINIGVFELIMENPRRLHDSPEKWAVIVLTNNEDIEALERYYLN